MTRSFIDRVAVDAGVEPAMASKVIDEFCLAQRRALDEYKGINGDYVGEQLHWDIGDRAFFHILGFLDQFSEKYQWEPGTAREYVARLLTEDEWKPFSQEYFRAKMVLPKEHRPPRNHDNKPQSLLAKVQRRR